MCCRAGLLMVLSVLAPMLSCAKKQTIIVIDDWWNVDFAKNRCEIMARNGGAACSGDPTWEVRDFEAQLRSAFASDGSCRGIVLASFGPGQAASKAASEADTSKADWQLMLNFQVGESSQTWTMVHRNQTTSGRGNPREIIHTVCAVVKQVGGSISD